MFYSQDKKNVTQFVPSEVWKVVYTYYKLKYLDFTFQEGSLRDRLWDTLNLKINTSNEEGAKRVIF
jgi:hypothetical protein